MMECRNDQNATDSNGDTCNDLDWYDWDYELNQPSWRICSARNDTRSFRVADACCYCGGGEINWDGWWSRQEESPVPLETKKVCFDTDYFRDT